MEFTSFQPALYAATVMNAFDRPWCIAGGWAIDLWLRQTTRDHGSVQIAVLRDDQMALRDFLPHAKLTVAGSGRRLPPGGRQLLMLVDQLELQVDRGHQLAVLLQESSAGDWVYPRDPAITMPLDRWITRGEFSVPVIAPEIALLHKSATCEPKDLLDFHSVLDQFQPIRRDWLASAIRHLNPSHPWLPALTAQRTASL